MQSPVCHQCANQLAAHAQFCPHCGTRRLQPAVAVAVAVADSPYRVAAPTAPPPPRPNLDDLGYGEKLAIPNACTCCMGLAETTYYTDQAMPGSRRMSWFNFPYCKKCRWHMIWSGRWKTGVVDKIGYLFAGGGLIGGVALGRTGEEASQGRAIVFALAFGVAAYLVCMALVALLGLAIAPRKRECTCRGAAVRIRRGHGVWHFRFTNPQFEDAFRTMNRGFEPIVARTRR